MPQYLMKRRVLSLIIKQDVNVSFVILWPRASGNNVCKELQRFDLRQKSQEFFDWVKRGICDGELRICLLISMVCEAKMFPVALMRPIRVCNMCILKASKVTFYDTSSSEYCVSFYLLYCVSKYGILSI